MKLELSHANADLVFKVALGYFLTHAFTQSTEDPSSVSYGILAAACFVI
jgi:hypothetical protein